MNPLWTFPLWLLQPPAFLMAHDICSHSAHSAFFISTEENVFPTAKRTSKKLYKNFFSSVSFALELLCFLVPMEEYLYRAKIFVLRHDFIWAKEARLGRQIHYQPPECQHKCSLNQTHSSKAIKSPINYRPGESFNWTVILEVRIFPSAADCRLLRFASIFDSNVLDPTVPDDISGVVHE